MELFFFFSMCCKYFISTREELAGGKPTGWMEDLGEDEVKVKRAEGGGKAEET